MQAIDARKLKEWLDAGEAVLVDVREVEEYAERRIAGAVLNPLSQFDAGKLPGVGERKLVIHCRTHGRSQRVCAAMVEAGWDAELYFLYGGIEAWHAAGLPTQGDCKA